MYSFILTKSRLKTLQHWMNGQHPPLLGKMPEKITNHDHLVDKLKYIANYLLVDCIQNQGGMRVDEGSSVISYDYLFINPDFFAGKINPLQPVGLNSIMLTHQRLTWNDFVDLPFGLIQSTLKGKDTLYFMPPFCEDVPHERPGIFVDFKSALLSKSTFTHSNFDNLCKENGYSNKGKLPLFRIYTP